MASYSLVPPDDDWDVFFDAVARFPAALDPLMEFLGGDLATNPWEGALPLPADEGQLPRYLRPVPGTDLAVQFRVSDLMSAVLIDELFELPPASP